MYLQHYQSFVAAHEPSLKWSDMGGRRRQLPARVDIISEGERADAVYVLVNGWAAPYRSFEDGRRQVMALLLPGDCCHIDLLSESTPLHSIGTITECTVDVVSRAAIRDLLERRPELSRTFWSELLASAAIQQEWTVNLGRRTATERLGHLFCEIMHRLRLLGRLTDNSCDFPLTQVDLADAVGLTPVHLNRTLQTLRARKLVVLERRRLFVPDLDRLESASLFHARYLESAQDPQPGRGGSGYGIHSYDARYA